MTQPTTQPIARYSQGEADLVIADLLRQLNLDLYLGFFVEIGVGDGTQNNTRSLAERGWRGLWVGNEPLVVQPTGVRFQLAQVELDNLETLTLPHGPVDVFSLDIDGNDYWIAEQLVPKLKPSVLVVEYNKDYEYYDINEPWIMPYTPGYKWKPGMPFGASLTAWKKLLEPMGYALVRTSWKQVNAFFIRP